MKKLMISNPEIMQLALKDEIIRSEDSRYDHRMHGVLLVSHGINCYQVSKWFGVHSSTVERWVHLFEKSGFDNE